MTKYMLCNKLCAQSVIDWLAHKFTISLDAKTLSKNHAHATKHSTLIATIMDAKTSDDFQRVNDALKAVARRKICARILENIMFESSKNGKYKYHIEEIDHGIFDDIDLSHDMEINVSIPITAYKVDEKWVHLDKPSKTIKLKHNILEHFITCKESLITDIICETDKLITSPIRYTLSYYSYEYVPQVIWLAVLLRLHDIIEIMNIPITDKTFYEQFIMKFNMEKMFSCEATYPQACQTLIELKLKHAYGAPYVEQEQHAQNDGQHAQNDDASDHRSMTERKRNVDAVRHEISIAQEIDDADAGITVIRPYGDGDDTERFVLHFTPETDFKDDATKIKIPDTHEEPINNSQCEEPISDIREEPINNAYCMLLKHREKFISSRCELLDFAKYYGIRPRTFMLHLAYYFEMDMFCHG